MTTKNRYKIIAEHIIFDRTFTKIAADLGISKQSISNDRRRNPSLWESETENIKAFQKRVLIPQRKAFLRRIDPAMPRVVGRVT